MGNRQNLAGIKPGKPFAFGKLSNSWFCGLPGNPVSATLTFYQLVQPLLAKLSGNTASGLPARQRVRTASRLKKTPGRLDFQRGVLQRNADLRRASGSRTLFSIMSRAPFFFGFYFWLSCQRWDESGTRA